MKKHKSFSFVLGLSFILGGVAIGSGVVSESAHALESEYCDQTGTSCEVANFDQLESVMDKMAEEASGEVTIRLLSDIGWPENPNHLLEVPEGWATTLNLDGKTLELRGDGTRGLRNDGSLVIAGNGTVTNGSGVNEAYGLIDNYGDLVIESGTFVDYGQGNGSSVKNRPSGHSSLTVRSGVVFLVQGVNLGNAAIYSDGELVIEDGVQMTTKSDRAYTLIVNSGSAAIGTTVGNTSSPVVVSGVHGGLAINGGSVVVNNGEYSCTNYYGVWITNDDGETNVDIKYGEFYGNKYGLYAAVDDGHQDASNADILIRDGVFVGETKGAVALNAGGSERVWGLTIYGGKFSSLPAFGYIAEGKEIYDVSPDGPYFVDEDVEIAYPDKVDVLVGGEYTFPYNDIVWKYGTVGFSNPNIIEASGWTIVGKEVGETLANIQLHDYITPTDENVNIKVYEIEVEGPEEAGGNADFVAGQISEMIKAGTNVNPYMTLNLDEVVERLAEGEKISIEMAEEKILVEDWEHAEAYEEVMEQVKDNETILDFYSILMGVFMRPEDSDQGSEVGLVYQVAEPVKVEFVIPEEYRKAPEGFRRIFTIIRGHIGIGDGEYEVTGERLETEFDGERVSAATDKFSSFMIVYEDVEDEQSETAPQTGVFTRSDEGAKSSKAGLVLLFAGVMILVGSKMIFEGFKGIRESR